MSKNESSFRKIANNIPVLVYRKVLYSDGKLAFPFINRASIKILGLEPDEIVRDANLLYNLIHSDDFTRFNKSVVDSAKALEPFDEELRFNVNGNERWIAFKSHPQLQKNGDVIWDGVMIDITDYKLVQREYEADSVIAVDPEVKKALDLRLARGEIDENQYKLLLKTVKKYEATSNPEVSAEPISTVQVVRNGNVNVSTSEAVADGVRSGIMTTRSFTGSAVLTWILYYIGFYIIGFIANLVYLSKAKQIQQETGTAPSGKGCLTLLLFVHFWIPLIIIGLLVLGGVSIFDWVSDLLGGIF